MCRARVFFLQLPATNLKFYTFLSESAGSDFLYIEFQDAKNFKKRMWEPILGQIVQKSSES